MRQKLIALNKDKLEAERTRLEKLLASFARRSDKTGGADFQTNFPNIGDTADDNAQEVEMYETNLGEEKALEQRLHKVNAALERIHSGVYGKCAVGGEEIEEARLQVAPEADTCVKHSS